MPKDLVNQILIFRMAPNKQLNVDIQSISIIDSIIINQKHAAIFANWIDRKQGKSNYKFSLLYRDRRDGNTAAAFHAKCDNKGATIIVAKITNSEQIIGGYNPLSWDSSNSGKPTKDSFIFSFTDKNDLKSANVVYSKGGQHSIYCLTYCGPVFGSGGDLGINYSDKKWHSYVGDYPTLNFPNSIDVDDYEVFQVIKK